MPLPTRDEALTMDWSKDGSPWVKVAAKSDIDLDGLDWSKDGSPWWGLEVSAPAPAPSSRPSVVSTFSIMMQRGR